jgi:hypothetical protein
MKIRGGEPEPGQSWSLEVTKGAGGIEPTALFVVETAWEQENTYERIRIELEFEHLEKLREELTRIIVSANRFHTK